MIIQSPLLYLAILVILTGVAWWLLRPGRGFLWRWQRTRQMTRRVIREDALKHIHRCERYKRPPTVESLAGAIQITADQAADLLSELEQHGFVRIEGENFYLTAEGRDYALHIIRAHRLWERYLADETGYASAQWHEQAEQIEHRLSPEAVADLAMELGNPTYDPHGDPIPTASGSLVPHGGKPLTMMLPDAPARIVHLEDEPEAVFAQLVAEGLNPGMEVQLIEVSPQRVRFWANGDEHLLAPIVAANISVIPLLEPSSEPEPVGERLSSLQQGEKGEVLRLSRASRGSERRRFLDLGILPGTVVTAELISPSGDPTAYRIRDALIALRREQADLIQIRKLTVEESA